jgi:hypothetical protein
MRLLSWLRFSKAGMRPAPAARPTPLRLSIEPLEQRATPSGLAHGHNIDGSSLGFDCDHVWYQNPDGTWYGVAPDYA